MTLFIRVSSNRCSLLGNVVPGVGKSLRIFFLRVGIIMVNFSGIVESCIGEKLKKRKRHILLKEK